MIGLFSISRRGQRRRILEGPRWSRESFFPLDQRFFKKRVEQNEKEEQYGNVIHSQTSFGYIGVWFCSSASATFLGMCASKAIGISTIVNKLFTLSKKKKKKKAQVLVPRMARF